MKVKFVTRWLFCVGFIVVAATACGQRGAKGSLEIRVEDHADAIGYFSKVNITIDAIRLSPKIGFRFWRMGWLELSPSLRQLDLTEFVNNSGATIFTGEINADSFEAFDLRVREVRGVLKEGSKEVQIDNKVKPIALPFSVNPGESSTLVIDLTVMDMSDHPPATYELQLIGYEVYNNGKLVDKVPPG
jgi:hypothetical protein